MPTYAYGILIGAILVIVVWFLFIAPMERRVHERKMELMRRKLERNDERLKQPGVSEHSDNAGKDANSNLVSRDIGVE